MEWKTVKLGEVCDLIKNREKGVLIDKSNYVSTENMLPNKGGVVPSSITPYDGAIIYHPKDVLMSNIRPYFKKIWFADKVGGCSGDVLCFRSNSKIDSSYLYYLLSQDLFFDYVMAGSKGTKMPRGDKGQIMQYEFSLPPLETQRCIVAILSSLDDKIENNNRINRNLEAQAQALFKSWFVDFEPWGGVLPEDWEEGKLGEIAIFKRGKGILGKDARNGNIPVVAGGLEPAYYHDTANTKAPVVTISGSGANAGFMRMYNEDVWASDCSFIDSKCENLLWAYCFLSLNKRLLRHAQTGAVQPHVKASDVNDFDVIIPTRNIINDFQQKVKPLFDQIAINQQESLRLAALRDTLLPKLMRGEIEV